MYHLYIMDIKSLKEYVSANRYNLQEKGRFIENMEGNNPYIQRNRVYSSLFWRFAERCGAQGVSFVVSVILARILVPEVYGTIALVTVFMNILQVFIDSGLGNALIQKKDADDIDFSTVFYFNVVICCVLYFGMFFAAPYIAKFYGDKELVMVIRVLSLILVISGVKNVQQAFVSKNMLFKRFFYATLGGTIGAAFVGITMAYIGFGVWALVVQQILNATVDTVILWVTVKWRPQKVFCIKRLKSLYSYGWKLLIAGLLNTLYGNIRQLIIGKMYSPEDLAYYNRGHQFPDFIINNVNSSIDSVLFPVMSNVQDNHKSVKQMTRKAIKISVYIMAPLMLGLAFTADTVVRLILTDKWIECVPFLQIFCVTLLFHPIHTANLNAIKAMGRSDLFLKLEIVKKCVGIVLLFSTMWFGVMVMAYSVLVNSILSQIINSWPNRKLLNYSYGDQLKDILPCILLAIGMGICVRPISQIGMSAFATLFVQIISGAAIYIGVSAVLKIDSFVYLYDNILNFLSKKGHN